MSDELDIYDDEMEEYVSVQEHKRWTRLNLLIGFAKSILSNDDVPWNINTVSYRKPGIETEFISIIISNFSKEDVM